MEKAPAKRLLSLVLCIVMMLSLLPSAAFAAEDANATEQSAETTAVPTESSKTTVEEEPLPDGTPEPTAEATASSAEETGGAAEEGEEPVPSEDPAEEAAEEESTEEESVVEHNIIVYRDSYDIAPGVVEADLTLNDSTGENLNKAYVFQVEKSAENA